MEETGLWLSPPRSLQELADYANREIRTRLDDLGSPNLEHNLEVVGDGSTLIRAVCPVESLREGCLTFAISAAYLKRVEQSEAAAVIIPTFWDSLDSKPCIKAPEPRLVFSVLLGLIAGRPTPVSALPDGIRYKDRSSVEIGDDTVIGDWCYIGAGVRIGRGCLIYPHVFIDDEVTLDDCCIIYPNVTLFKGSVLGRNVIIHSGSVVGGDGFGFNQFYDLEKNRLRHLKNEHVGGVIIGDHVEVGSQVCIDRGLAGATVIGAGTKIDNLTQVAHNVRIGRDCIILSQVGIAGTARLGDKVFLLGQCGVKNGTSIGDEAVVTSMTGVSTDVPAGRNAWAGRPAQAADIEWKQKAMTRRELPRVREFWRVLKKADTFAELKAEFFKRKKTQ